MFYSRSLGVIHFLFSCLDVVFNRQSYLHIFLLVPVPCIIYFDEFIIIEASVPAKKLVLEMYVTESH